MEWPYGARQVECWTKLDAIVSATGWSSNPTRESPGVGIAGVPPRRLLANGSEPDHTVPGGS
jgi:hypothetical protein